MQTRRLGNTDLYVSLLGFGCAPIASRAGFAESKRALELARESGITYFDTADMYGVGGSERTIARVLGQNGIVVSTKAGFMFSKGLKAVAWIKPLLRPLVTRLKAVKNAAAAAMTSQKSQNFEPDYLAACVDGSLQRLGVSRLDLFFLHEPPIAAVRRSDVYAKLAELKRAGKIREYGVSGETEVAMAALAHPETGITALQINANLLEPLALTSVLPIARSRGIGVIARQPFANGRLLHDERLKSCLREHGLPDDAKSISSLAVRYVAAFDGIAAVLPSMMKPEHLKANVAAVASPELTDKELAAIAAFGAPLPQKGAVAC